MRFRRTPAALSESRLSRTGPYALEAAPPVLLILLLSLLSLQSIAAPAVAPALVEQAKRMSPAQREALARQYGIPLGAFAGPDNAVVEEQALQEALQRPRAYSDLEILDVPCLLYTSPSPRD